jgi:hypothetical protein
MGSIPHGISFFFFFFFFLIIIIDKIGGWGWCEKEEERRSTGRAIEQMKRKQSGLFDGTVLYCECG